MQTWRFTVLENAVSIEGLKKAISESANKAGVRFFGFNNPSCVILISNDARNSTGCQDCACAAQNIMIAASSYSLGSVWINALMTMRDVEPVKSFLDEIGVPPSHIVWVMVALGHASSEGASPARKRQVVKYVDRDER